MLKLEELEVYQLSETLADIVWEICVDWDWFAKDTVGKQLVQTLPKDSGDLVSKKISNFAITHEAHCLKHVIGCDAQKRENYFHRNKKVN